ncbi:MAG: DNA polymerase III subunit beta [Acidiferrobacteraceae bacterium]
MMEISISRDALMKPLAQVAGVVERRQTLPILAYALIRFDGNRMTLVGTDLEVEVLAATSEAKGTAGELTMPARKLLDICRSLPAEAPIKISLKGEKAIVSSGRSRFTLTTMPSADFPGIEPSEWTEEMDIAQGVLKDMLEATQFCMAHQDVRYYLNGLLLELEKGKLRAVATDGHRMAMKELDLDTDGSETRQVIVPRKGVLELTRFLDDSDTPVRIQLGTNHIRVALPDLTFTSKLIDGRFPDYTKVIPQNQTKEILADRQELRDALSRAAILSNEKYRGVRLTLGDKSLKVTAHNPEQEEAEEELTVDYSGEALEIGFNVTYLIEAMNTLDSDQVKLGLSDSNSSCTLVSPADSSSLYVIMPMRL